MSELISGKEALIALANGEEVEYQEPVKDRWVWMNAKRLTAENILNHTASYVAQSSPSCVEHNSYTIQFRLKPQTIKINGIEVEKPKDIAVDPVTGSVRFFYGDLEKTQQASEALRSVFNG